MPNQTVKNCLKVKKIKLLRMKFFLKKQYNFHVHISPFHSAKFLEFFELIQSYQGVLTLGPKWPICPEQFFWCKPLLLLSSTSCAKFSKSSYSRSKVMRMLHFMGPKWSICPKFIFWKLLISFSCKGLTLSLCKISKKSFHQIQSYEDAQFLGPKWSISPNDNFFRKPVSEPCFFHSHLSTCHKSKSDINLLVKYWWLKNTEIWLVNSHIWV